MKSADFNPFSWDNSSKKVQSSVISLELQTENATRLNVSNLDDYIEIVIPISTPPSNTSNDEDEADKGDEKGEIKHQDENEGEK